MRCLHVRMGVPSVLFGISQAFGTGYPGHDLSRSEQRDMESRDLVVYFAVG